MSVTINIHGETAGEALAELRGFTSGMGGVTPASGVDKGATDEAPARGRGRGKKGGEVAVAVAEPEGTAAPETKPNISTGGERNDPNAGQEAPQEQQAPQEQPTEKPVTIDDVRAAAVPYITKWTQKVAGIDLAIALKEAVGKEKISLLDASNVAELTKARDAFVAAYGDGTKRYEPKA